MAFRDVAMKFISHVYWCRKTDFMLERDQYTCWTIFAVEEGRFLYTIGEQSGEAGFGDLVICPPHQVFQRKTLEPLSFHFLQFVWFSEPFDREEFAWSGKLAIIDKERLASNYRYLRQINGWDEESTAHKQHMVNDLLRLVKMEQDRKEVQEVEVDEAMEQAHEQITEQAFESLSMEELATRLALTPVQLTRRFRKAFGQTPSEFLTDIRITRARHLLEGTTLRLDEIAALCGYENGFYLSRVFSKKTGMPPSVYRSQYRV